MFLAVLVYIQVNALGSSGSVQRALSVAVQVTALPNDLAVTSVAPHNVTVTVRGDAQVIQSLHSTDLQALLDLRSASAGRQAYYIEAAVPRGVQLIGVTPASATVVLAPVIDVETKVSVDVSGEVAQGYAMGSPVVSPSVVVLHGMASALQDVAHTAAVVDVSGADATVRAQVAPVAMDSGGNPVTGVQVVPSTVAVTVPIGRSVPEKSVPVAVTVTGQPGKGYAVGRAAVSPAAVTVLAPASVLRGVHDVRTAPISVSGATGAVDATALIVAPAGAIAVEPDSANVSVPVGPVSAAH